MVEAAADERAAVSSYAAAHNLQHSLQSAVQTVMRERAPNGLARVAHLLLEQAYGGAPAAAPSVEEPSARSLDSWRERLVRDAAVGLELEVRAEVTGSTLEAERCAAFRQLMEEGPLAHEPTWYKDDENFGAAMEQALALKRRIVAAATVLEMIAALPADAQQRAAGYIVRWLDSPSGSLRRAAAELLGGNTLYGVTVGKPPMPSAVLAPHADAIVRRLDDADAHIRHAAGEMLALLPTTKLEAHAVEIVAHLEASERDVRDNTLQALGKLPPAVIAPHTSAVVRRLQDEAWVVRKSALWVLRRTPQEALVAHAELLRQRLDFPKVYFRLMVHALLCKAAPLEQAEHLGVILRHLEDEDEANRWAAVEALGKLEPEVLAAHVHGLLAALEDPKKDVRAAAVEALSQPAVLAPHAALVAERLAHTQPFVRRAACEIGARLGTDALEGFAAAVAPLLRDEHHDLRVAALGLLGKMRAEPLAPHAAGLVLCLEDATSAAVREAAVELLARHAAALLSPHADAIAERTRHADAKTRYAALDALSRHPSVRAARLADVVARLDDREAFVRLFAAQTLSFFGADELRPHQAALRKRIMDYDENVRKTAQLLLSKLAQPAPPRSYVLPATPPAGQQAGPSAGPNGLPDAPPKAQRAATEATPGRIAEKFLQPKLSGIIPLEPKKAPGAY